jgi:hypothetical protein
VRRLEALTGGDEVGTGCLGVSTGFFFGKGIFARGGFGVSIGTVAGSPNVLEGMFGRTSIGISVGIVWTALAGVLDSVTSEMRSDSEEMVMILAGRGMAAWGVRALFTSAVLAHSGIGFLGENSSPLTGLDALHSAGRWIVFCLFGALSSGKSFSCSFSIRTWYGDLMGTAFPTGPCGVPSRVLSDLCFS